MLIDWFTLGAQMVNFIVLVWLMKRYLYQPVLRAIDAREAHIASQLAGADAERREAERSKAEFEQKNATLDQQRARLLDEATAEAHAARRRILEEAREAAQALSVEQVSLLESGLRSLNQAISRRAEEEIFAIARRTLERVADASLEERVARAFARHLEDLDGAARSLIAGAIGSGGEAAIVRSAFPLAEPQRTVISDAVHTAFSTKVPLAFETVPGVVCGVELLAGGYKLAWSVGEHLASLEKSVAELINQYAESHQAPSHAIHEQQA